MHNDSTPPDPSAETTGMALTTPAQESNPLRAPTAAETTVAIEPRRALRQTLLVVGVLFAIGALLFALAHWFGSSEVQRHGERLNRPRVMHTLPVDGESAVRTRATFRAELFTPTTGRGVAVSTISDESVRLIREKTGERVSASLSAAADGASISLTPRLPLSPGEAYRFEITGDLRDEMGEHFLPYVARVMVTPHPEDEEVWNVAYEQIPQPQVLERSKYTVLRLGPAPGGEGLDLFAGTADGRIFRFAIDADGNLTERQVIDAVIVVNQSPRLISGLAFDPNDPSVLWVSHGVAALSGAMEFTGAISTLSGEGFGEYEDRIVGLPRAFKDHLNFALAFGPDGTLYVSQGSNTAVGAPDIKWNNRPERLLTAAVLAIDVNALPSDGPLNVVTPDGGGRYDPHAPDAPLRIHATGVRSGWDLLWHSSGRLFTAINGAGRGGNTPAIAEEGHNLLTGPILNVPITTDDTLADVTRPGSFHGHPNPIRGEFVLMGGNPTTAIDPYEVPAYPVGTLPEPNFDMPAFNFGKGFSINGLAECRADVFGGKLRGAIFAPRFAAGNDILVLMVGSSGEVSHSVLGIEGFSGLGSPLSICEDPHNGNLYVSEFDGGRIMLLRPMEGQSRVVRTPNRSEGRGG